MAGEKILHVGYDSMLIEVREAVLRRYGYSVFTVEANEAAKQFPVENVDLVIVGNGGTLEERREIVTWFATHRPGVPVLVMRAGVEESFPEATVEFIGDTPQDWIQSIKGALRSKEKAG